VEIRDLEYFLACADTGSFTAAAERVHIVQSAMSSAVARLERELDVVLIDRSVTPVALTEHGVVLKAAALRILDELQAARDDLDAVTGTVRGTVVFAGTLNTGPLDVASLLAAIRSRHPEVVVRVRQFSEGSAANLRSVLDGTCDIGLVTGGDGMRAPAVSDRTSLQELWSEPLVFVCGADHRLAGSSAVTVEQIREEVNLRFPPGWGISRTVDGVIGPRPDATEVAGYDLMRDLIREGFGATLMPASAIGKRSALRAITVDERRLTWTLSAAVDGRRRLTRATQAVLSMLTSSIGEARSGNGRGPRAVRSQTSRK
jgi:DNA-binding transcriptional LysR family regulator